MMNHKLRYKILLGALILVFTVCIVITAVVSVIISRQNRELVHTGMTNAMSVIRDSLVDKQASLSDLILNMTAVNKIGDDIKFLTGFKDSGLNLSRQSYEKIGNAITNTALLENLWRVRVYSKEGELLNYFIHKDQDHRVAGFQYDGRFHYRSFSAGQSYDQIPLREAAQIEEVSLAGHYGSRIPEQAMVLFNTSDHHFLGVTVMIPVYANFYNQETEKTEPVQCGLVIAEERLSDIFVDQIGRITGMEMNLFVDENFSAGAVDAYKKVDISDIPEIHDGEWTIQNQAFSFSDIKIKDQHYFQAMLPVYSQNKFIGGLLILQSDEIVKANTRQMILMIGLVALACMVLVTPLAYVAAGRVVLPLIDIVEKLKDIAEGEGDLTGRLTVRSRDEIGQVAQWFNAFIDKIHKLISEVSRNGRDLNTSASTLAEISMTMTQGAEQTSTRASSVSAAGEEMSVSMSSVASAMEQASGNMGMVASATEEMTNTISEILKNTVTAKEIADEVVEKTDDASIQIRELGNAADDIGHVVEVITDISDQVNLLALNATIEAARAGEAGKGFAVVAGEIKDLAGQTANATREIKEKVSKIRTSTGTTMDRIGSISEVAGKVNEIAVIIASAVEEQSVTTRSISENILQVTRGIDKINDNILQSSQVSAEIAKDMTEVTLTATDMAQDSTRVDTRSKELAGLSEKLMEQVKKFKI